MKLLIGNRNYSSWSLRAWLALRAFDVPFDDEVLQLGGEGYRTVLAERSPSGRVPVLIDADLVVPETLAIIEYVAELHPDRAIWPADRRQRAQARAVSAEMHAGFATLRWHAPMNLRADYPGRVDPDAVAGDLKRIETIWGDLLTASGGPYLFGSFCAADAMFAPVATRIRTYDLPVSDTSARYVEAIYALPAFQEWLVAAIKEPWILEEEELPPRGDGAAA